MIGKQIVPQDEEPVNQLVRVFDIAQLENNEPFLAHTYQLKELRYRIETIRMEFPPKNHYHKNGNGLGNGNSNKQRYEFTTSFFPFLFLNVIENLTIASIFRWSSSIKPHNKNGNDIKPHRKNSNPMSNFNFVTMQQVNCNRIDIYIYNEYIVMKRRMNQFLNFAGPKTAKAITFEWQQHWFQIEKNLFNQ